MSSLLTEKIQKINPVAWLLGIMAMLSTIAVVLAASAIGYTLARLQYVSVLESQVITLQTHYAVTKAAVDAHEDIEHECRRVQDDYR